MNNGKRHLLIVAINNYTLLPFQDYKHPLTGKMDELDLPLAQAY